MRFPAAIGTLLFLGLACTDFTAPTLPPADQFEAPPAYRTWWDEVAACSGRAGDFEAVRFYRAPGAGEDSLTYRDRRTGRSYYGEWDPRSNSIYLAWGQLQSSNIVRHEMLHAVLRSVGHPRRYFDGACSPLVSY